MKETQSRWVEKLCRQWDRLDGLIERGSPL